MNENIKNANDEGIHKFKNQNIIYNDRCVYNFKCDNFIY